LDGSDVGLLDPLTLENSSSTSSNASPKDASPKESCGSSRHGELTGRGCRIELGEMALLPSLSPEGKCTVALFARSMIPARRVLPGFRAGTSSPGWLWRRKQSRRLSVIDGMHRRFRACSTTMIPILYNRASRCCSLPLVLRRARGLGEMQKNMTEEMKKIGTVWPYLRWKGVWLWDISALQSLVFQVRFPRSAYAGLLCIIGCSTGLRCMLWAPHNTASPI
jgi:hypothetical protein